MVQRSAESLGCMDIRVHNAGMLHSQEVLDSTEADYNVDGGAVVIAQTNQCGTDSLVHSQAGQGM